MRKDLAVTHNTGKDFAVIQDNKLISAALARAGIPERPPAALGRTSWLDVQTLGQLSAALRSEAAPQRGAAPSSGSSTAARGTMANLYRNTFSLTEQQNEWADLKAEIIREHLRERRNKEQKSARLAALKAAIDAMDAAVGRALASLDLITYLVLIRILAQLWIEYRQEAAAG
jgi:hypothetical protein